MKSDGGKGTWKNDKGKSFWDKSGLGKKGKTPEKGGKGGKQAGACHNCGKTGHYARDCWKRVSPIEETVGGGASSSSTGQTGAATSSTPMTTASVKMVRMATPPDTRSLEIFDLTGSGSEDNEFPWRVGMIEVGNEVTDEEFYDCVEPVVSIPLGVAIVAMDLQDESEEKLVQMVSAGEREGEECLVTLDSGADISVLPKAYADVGQWAPGSTSLRMVDAQGKRIAHSGVTKARISTTDANGKRIEMVEEFVLGNVQHPILCAGRLRRGWSHRS